MKVPDSVKEISYRYQVHNEQTGVIDQEFQVNRSIDVSSGLYNSIDIYDEWHPRRLGQNVYYSSAFTDVLHKRSSQAIVEDRPGPGSTHLIQLRAPELAPHIQVCIVGNDPLLGTWDPAQAVPLTDSEYPVWQAFLPFRGPSRDIEYKFILKSKESGELIAWEEGPNRAFSYSYTRKRKQLTLIAHESLHLQVPTFKGAGVAIPVFSLRSENSGGIGEFSDLIGFTDWAVDNHLHLVQILPINDTTATRKWIDSYPYSGISVFALHPIYIRPSSIASLADSSLQNELEEKLSQLNGLQEIDYEAVLEVKFQYLQALYQQEKSTCFQEEDYQTFFEANEEWLRSYAAFSAIRDRYDTADFRQWPEFSIYQEEAIMAFTDPDSSHFDEVGFYYFIQYHLHKQLLEASAYAKEHGVVLKGDIPIGIYRHSVDAWMSPHLFHMDAQAGAPPDDFAVHGQNWRFPTYNWEEMAKDEYAWWKQRMKHMSTYFHSYRIDHILGFFRIWEIPGHAVQGIMGQFNPSLPLSIEELMARGVWMDEDRFCQPYIRAHFLKEVFGAHADAVIREFLEEYQTSCYRFQQDFRTQREIEAYVDQKIKDIPESRLYYEAILNGLYRLLSEVLFFKDKGGHGYCPRISIFETKSFQELDWELKDRIRNVYHEFFYHRHEHFWREQAMIKLPAICEATNMLVCGEDLGMVPACVPGVMDELGLLSLEIQRMPKDPAKEFAHPHHAPALSVVSPSSHDMPGIRGWWEQDRSITERFFYTVLGQHGDVPYFCEPWIAEIIVMQHLESPAMWAIFPIQDLMAIDGQLRRENPHDEQINDPANPENYWRYRFHLNNEELRLQHDLREKVSSLIQKTGRSPKKSHVQPPHSLTNVMVTS